MTVRLLMRKQIYFCNSRRSDNRNRAEGPRKTTGRAEVGPAHTSAGAGGIAGGTALGKGPLAFLGSRHAGCLSGMFDARALDGRSWKSMQV